MTKTIMHPHEKNNFGSFPYTVCKYLNKMDKRPKVRVKTIQLLEENSKSYDLGVGLVFWYMTPKTETTDANK